MSRLHTFGAEPYVYVDDRVRPYEPAARNYCARIGQDPDAVTEIEHPFGLQGVPTFRPAWCFAADKLIDLSHMLGALRETSGKGN